MQNDRIAQYRRPYQTIYEDLYEITRRRDLKLEELALFIYLRSKYCHFGKRNPFYHSDARTCFELNITPKTLSKVRKRVQLKGLIKFDSGCGRGKATLYCILDQLHAMEKVSQLVKKVSQTGYLSPRVKVPRLGDPRLDKDNKEEEIFQGMTEKDREPLRALGLCK